MRITINGKTESISYRNIEDMSKLLPDGTTEQFWEIYYALCETDNEGTYTTEDGITARIDKRIPEEPQLIGAVVAWQLLGEGDTARGVRISNGAMDPREPGAWLWLKPFPNTANIQDGSTDPTRWYPEEPLSWEDIVREVQSMVVLSHGVPNNTDAEHEQYES